MSESKQQERTRRLRNGITALAIVASIGLVGSLWLEVGPWASCTNAPRATGALPEPDPQRAGDSPATSASARSTPRIDRHLVKEAGDAGAARGGEPRIELARLFRGDCQFGVNAHCLEWAERAAQCDGGDALACVELGELLIGESPMQPLWGSMLLQRACELGRADVCARADQWREWSRFGYTGAGPGDDEAPEDLTDACDAGSKVACGLIEMRGARGERGVNNERALESCRAGFRDVCASLMEIASTAMAAMTAGCELPDAWMCYHLAGYYSSYCVGPDRPVGCPAPDPERAAHYRTLACQLDPVIAPCRSDD